MRTPSKSFGLSPLVVVVVWLAGAPAGAQAPPPPGAAPPAPDPAAAAATTPAPAPYGRVGSAEVAIVGGNVAGARERALTEAMKQAVEQALAVLVPDARVTQAKAVTRALGRARNYVRRYRTLEEGERGHGIYGIRIDAEINDAALLRDFDKSTGAAAAPASGAAVPSCLLVATGVSDAGAATSRALAVSGTRVVSGTPDQQDPAKAVEAAGKAGLSAVAFVSGTATAEGKVRGPALEAVSCALSVRLMAAGTGAAIADESESGRSFGPEVDQARALCFQRAASAAVPRLLLTASGRFGSDGRITRLEVDVVEPAAVPALVKQLREIGSVSTIDIRRIAAARAEILVRSRLAAQALAAALARDGGGVAVSAVEVAGDVVRARVRLRESASSPSPPPPGAAAPQTPAPATAAAANGAGPP